MVVDEKADLIKLCLGSFCYYCFNLMPVKAVVEQKKSLETLRNLTSQICHFFCKQSHFFVVGDFQLTPSVCMRSSLIRVCRYALMYFCCLNKCKHSGTALAGNGALEEVYLQFFFPTLMAIQCPVERSIGILGQMH